VKTQAAIHSPTSRRSFLSRATSLTALAIVGSPVWSAENAGPPARARKPNSIINGVRIGCITYSYRGGNINTAEETLNALLQDGISEVELMDGPIRTYAGIRGGGGQRRPGGGASDEPSKPSDAEREEQLAKCRNLRKMYNDAGVNIHLHKLPFGPSDEDIDFNFMVAKALGCKGVTTERSDSFAKKVAPFADKHKIWVGFHNHTSNFPSLDKEDPLPAYGQYIGFNLDIGHYVAGTKGLSPIPVLEKYHDRIVSLHLKDRTPEGGNEPWGQGKTPIKEVLQLMKKEKWTFPADIELEYQIPAGSNSIAEVAKCLQYCKEALA
jgi:sugar phosphate isomerase/epimerase